MNKSSQFFSGEGEMCVLMRAYNWESSVLGGVDTWPTSLLTTLGILLHSKFPMFIYWGPHHICFYNDAYRSYLGNNAKHPAILGMAGEEAWPEIWPIVKPLIDQVLAGGEATWSEDQLIPIYRNGKMQDVYWTFSYSPVLAESGAPGGVFVTCIDTTAQVYNLKKLEESNQRFRNFILQAPIAMSVMRGLQFIIEIVNIKQLEIWGKEEAEILQKPLFEVFPEVKSQEFEALLIQVYVSGIPFTGNEMAAQLYRNGLLETAYFDFTYEPMRSELGEVEGIIVISVEVTAAVIARKKIEESEISMRQIASHLKLATDSANVGTWSTDMHTQKIEWSGLHNIMWGYDEKRKDLTFDDWHRPIWAEDKENAFNKIEQARVSHTAYEADYSINRENDGAHRYIRSFGKFYYNDKGEADKLTGISIDITEQKVVEQKLAESEEKYRNLFESIDQGLSIVEMIFDETNKPIDYRFIENNPVFQQQTGLPDVTNKTVREVIPDLDDFWFETYGNVALTGKPIRFTQKADALNSWFDVYAFRLGPQGSNMVVVLFTNITESKRAEHKLKESEAFNRTILESSPDCVKVLDMEGRIQYMNFNGLCQMEIEDFSTIKNKKWSLLWGSENEGLVKSAIDKVLAGETAQFTAFCETTKGTPKWWDVLVSPVGKPGELVQQIISVSRDITLAHEASNSFNFTISHDLRTPLSSIKSYAELLLLTNESLDDNAKKMLGRIDASADKMALLIKEILHYSSYAVSEIKLEKINVRELIEGIKTDIFESLISQNLEFIIGATPDISADKGMVGQVLTNMIGNAVKYSSKKENAVVKVEGYVSGNETIYTIEDKGIGIDIKYHNKVFELFKRMDNVKDFEGTGAGLAIVKRIVEKHKGRIWFKSELGKGTKFYVSFRNGPIG